MLRTILIAKTPTTANEFHIPVNRFGIQAG